MFILNQLKDKARQIKLVHLQLLAAFAAAYGALLIGEHVYLKEFLTTDENSYLFQAWLFLQGKLKLAAPPGVESFFHRMIINDYQVGWFSRYPPAHALWLVPGVAVGYPRLMVACAAFLTVWFLTKSSQRLKIPVWITIGLLFASPYFWLMQGSVLSHTSGLTATTVMLWAYLVWLDERDSTFLLIAGLVWAFLFLNRTYTAVLIAIPFAFHILSQLYQARTIKNLMAVFIFAGSAFTGVMVFFIYNYLMVGDPFMPTYLYYNPTEGLGFGPRNRPGFVFTPEMGWGYIKSNLSILNIRLWGFFGSLLVWLVLTIIGWRTKGISLLMLSASLLIWFGYGAFWFKGIDEVAPVYYYETLVFIVLLAAMGVSRLLELNWRIPAWSKFVVCMIAVGLVGLASAKNFYQNGAFIIQHHLKKSQYSRMISSVPPGSIVFVTGFPMRFLAETSWNPHGLESDPLVLRYGFGNTHLISHYFPDRPLYLVAGSPPQPPKLLNDRIQHPPTIFADKMYSQTGIIKTEYRVAESPNHQAGALGHRVFQYFIPGTYEVKFYFNAIGEDGHTVGFVDVVEKDDKKKLAHKDIKTGQDSASLTIQVDSITLVEPRIYFDGKGKLEFSHIEIRLLEKNL